MTQRKSRERGAETCSMAEKVVGSHPAERTLLVKINVLELYIVRKMQDLKIGVRQGGYRRFDLALYSS